MTDKFCKDCRHMEHPNHGHLQFARCLKTKEATESLCPVSGEVSVKTNMHYCTTMRDDYEQLPSCGSAAIWWEEKPVEKTLWEKLREAYDQWCWNRWRGQ